MKPVLRGLWAMGIGMVVMGTWSAGAWEVRDTASIGAFEAFHDSFAPAAFHFPRHGAGPLGWVGFNLYADVAAVDGFGDEDFADDDLPGSAIRGSLPGDFLSIARVGARKGLPGGIDLGVAYGEVLDADFDLLSADVKWSIIDGGLLKPALALRISGTRSEGSDHYDFTQIGADLTFSKGFANLVPYIGIGVARSESSLDRPGGDTLDVETTDQVLFAGVTINLLVPKINLSVEQGEHLQAAVRFSLGL
jgi:hypothetical protein